MQSNQWDASVLPVVHLAKRRTMRARITMTRHRDARDEGTNLAMRQTTAQDLYLWEEFRTVLI